MRSARLGLAIFLASMLCGGSLLHAAAFANLDFEQATIVPEPPGSDSTQPFAMISAASALPFWTVSYNTGSTSTIWANPDALDQPSIALVDKTNDPYGTPPIQGNYSVELYGVNYDMPQTEETAEISQTGDVPTGTKSIRFTITLPSVDSSSLENPIVTMNGVSIPVFALSSSGNTMQMAGDVRRCNSKRPFLQARLLVKTCIIWIRSASRRTLRLSLRWQCCLPSECY